MHSDGVNIMPYFLFGSEYIWSYFHVYTISGSEIMARFVLANLNVNWEIEKKKPMDFH